MGFPGYPFPLILQGGELDSTGVWKLKLRVGGLQPRKNAEQNTNADSEYEYALAA